MAFNWIPIFQQYSIEYIETGQDVAAGNVNISCPFCAEDLKHHMGVNLKNGYWGCWRDKAHRGKSPVRLLMALLRCNQREAVRLAEQSAATKTPGAYKGINFNISMKRGSLDSVLRLFDKFRDIGTETPAYNYLYNEREYKGRTSTIIRKHGLRWARSGEYKNRVVIPIHDRDENLVSITSRAIYANTRPKYLDIHKRRASTPTKECVYNMHLANRGRVLVICEGPFDAMTLDYLGAGVGVRAVALFTITMSEEQQYTLYDLATRFDAVVVCFDEGAMGQAMIVAKQLKAFMPVSVLRTPSGVEDLGALHKHPLISTQFVQKLLETTR